MSKMTWVTFLYADIVPYVNNLQFVCMFLMFKTQEKINSPANGAGDVNDTTDELELNRNVTMIYMRTV